MSGNIGANIWLTGEALREPEITTGVDVLPGVILLGDVLVHCGDASTVQGADISFPLSISAGAINDGGVEILSEALVFSGSIASAQAEFSIGSLELSTGTNITPDISGVSVAFTSVLYACQKLGIPEGASISSPLSLFAGDVDSGEVSLSFPLLVDTQSVSTGFYHGLAFLPGLVVLNNVEDIYDHALISDSTASELQIILYDVLKTYEGLSTSGSFLNVLIMEHITARVVAALPYMLEIFDFVHGSDQAAFSVYKLITAHTLVSADEDYDTQVAFNVTLSAALVLQSAVTSALDLTFIDAAEVLSANSANLQAVIDSVETLQAIISIPGTATLFLDSDEALDVSDEASTSAFLQALFSEQIDTYVSIRVGDDTFCGWVMNTESTGFSEYSNYPFNSLVSAEGRYFAVAQDGVYELTGDSDQGEPIAASIKTGLMDLETSFTKDAKAAYIGYTSTGRMVLKVSTTERGRKNEWWYEAKPSSAGAPRSGRFTIGRGLRSRYFQFELVNAEGDDFELDGIEIMYSILSRRLR